MLRVRHNETHVPSFNLACFGLCEIVAAISNANFEPDGILLIRIRRITNGGVENADGIFMITSDCHYQANTFATKNRTPNFYT